MAGPLARAGVTDRMPGVTVVIPTRNRPEFLRLTLQSVLHQRHVDLHVVVVDEASTDETAQVVARCADSRVRLIRHAVPAGVSTARNRGLHESTTEWVAFCDDDDLWSRDKLSRQVAAAREAGRDWAYAGCVYVNSEMAVQNGAPPLSAAEMAAALRRYNAMPAGASNVLIRRGVFAGLGGFDGSMTHLADWDAWLRLAAHGPPACVPEPLVGYRLHPGSASLRTQEMLGELEGLERRHGLTVDRCRFLRHLAHLCVRSGRHLDAARYWLRAVARSRGEYRPVDFSADVRLVREHALAAVARRAGGSFSHMKAARLQRERARDPNAAWKAQAQAWLDQFRA